MSNKYKSYKVFKTALEEHITSMKVKQIEKSLLSLQLILDARLSQLDPYYESNRYSALVSLAFKVLDLWELYTECVAELDSMNLRMFLDEEA